MDVRNGEGKEDAVCGRYASATVGEDDACSGRDCCEDGDVLDGVVFMLYAKRLLLP